MDLTSSFKSLRYGKSLGVFNEIGSEDLGDIMS
jgi:hypothetical protein